jgi:signal peptidase II
MLKNKGVFFVAAAAFLIDRVTKICVIQLVKPVSRMPVIDGTLSFPYLENKGAAFSVLTQHPLFLKLFAIATVIIISAYFLLSKREFLLKINLPGALFSEEVWETFLTG